MSPPSPDFNWVKWKLYFDIVHFDNPLNLQLLSQCEKGTFKNNNKIFIYLYQLRPYYQGHLNLKKIIFRLKEEELLGTAESVICDVIHLKKKDGGEVGKETPKKEMDIFMTSHCSVLLWSFPQNGELSWWDLNVQTINLTAW